MFRIVAKGRYESFAFPNIDWIPATETFRIALGRLMCHVRGWCFARVSPDSVNGSDSTAGLKRNLEKDDNKIVVTTIQKLNNLMKSEGDLPIYGKL